jgi:hypothetical protein
MRVPNSALDMESSRAFRAPSFEGDEALRRDQPLRPIVGHALIVFFILLVSAAGWMGSIGEQGPLRPGDLVSVRGISFVVPQPGMAVWADAQLSTGVEFAVGVETRTDGRVILHPSRERLGMQPIATTSTSPCLDGAYKRYGMRWATTFKWYFKSGSTPSNVTVLGAEGALKRAVANITGARNNCGLADNISASSYYAGRTSTSINISSSSSCLARDGKSIVGFGDLASGYLGMACWWTNSSNQAIEADIKLNKVEYGWVVSIPSSCYKKWSIEAVATHEFGHAFGLASVSETYHPNLTMSLVLKACQSSEVTLGLGDIRGLEGLY